LRDYAGQYRDRIGSSAQNIGSIFQRDPADRYQRLIQECAAESQLIHPHYGIRIQFRGGGKNRTERHIVDGLHASSGDLSSAVAGKSNDRGDPHQLAGIAGRQIILPEMQTGPEQQGKIRAVVDNELRPSLAAQAGYRFGGGVNFAAPMAFMAQLQKSRAAFKHCSCGGLEPEALALEDLRIEDGIDARQIHTATLKRMSLAIQAADVRAAAERIRPLARRTPVFTSAGFDAAAQTRVFFKCENLQKGGAFKIRGAANLILSLPPETLERGVVAYSSGNHAQAVAIAARHMCTQATIVMPEDAPRSKMDSTRSCGARIIIYDRFTQSREQMAEAILEESGATLVPPFDHPLIIAGQGTAALELLDEVGPLDALITPVGGGGLLSGCATIAKDVQRDIRVFGAEPEGANDTFLSLLAGERVAVNPHTIADGLRAPKPGELTFPIVKRHVERIALVSDDEILQTVKFLLLRLKILVEPSGAVGAAAVLSHKLPAEIRTVGVVLSGGNVDFEDLTRY
jgi:threonine dehydratase